MMGAQRLGERIGALALMVGLSISCSVRGGILAGATAEPTPLKAEPLALLVLTPGLLPHQPSAISYQPLAAAPTPSPTPWPSPTPVPSPIPTSTPDQRATRPNDQLTTIPSPTTTSTPPTPSLTPTSTPFITSTPTSTSLPTATPMPRPPADRPPDRIIAPAIGLDAPVVEIGWHLVERNGQWVSEWDTADGAAGFHRGSAYPGHAGNTVLSGHHNIRGEVFRHLIELQPGDLISLYVGRQEYRYLVQRVFLIPEKNASPEQRRENAKWIGPFPDERLTLVTCWPYTGNTHRVIVIARPAEGE